MNNFKKTTIYKDVPTTVSDRTAPDRRYDLHDLLLERDALQAEVARLREALEDIHSGKGDPLISGGDGVNPIALMHRAERALFEVSPVPTQSEDKS